MAEKEQESGMNTYTGGYTLGQDGKLYKDGKIYAAPPTNVLPNIYTDGPKYTFNEDKLLAEIKLYIDKTYSGHYVGNYQAMDVIHDSGHGMGFALGNVIKYAKRYGKKDGYNRADLLKLIHYGILALNCHDDNNEKDKNEQR